MTWRQEQAFRGRGAPTATKATGEGEGEGELRQNRQIPETNVKTKLDHRPHKEHGRDSARRKCSTIPCIDIRYSFQFTYIFMNLLTLSYHCTGIAEDNDIKKITFRTLPI